MIDTLGYCLIALAATGHYHDLGTSNHVAPLVRMENGTQIIHSQLQIHEGWRHPHAETSWFVSTECFYCPSGLFL